MHYAVHSAQSSSHPEGGAARAKPPGARAKRPVLLAVDDEVGTLREISRELRQRYGADYRVVCERSAEAA